MASVACIHGAGGRGSDWRFVAAELEALGHAVVAMDLPSDQDVGLDAYLEAVLAAIGDPPHALVLLAHSLGGFVAPLVCEHLPVRLMVLLTAMVPRPGETGHEWWENTGHQVAMLAQGFPDTSPETLFIHDVPPDVLSVVEPPRDQSGTLFDEPCPLAAWPSAPTRFLLCRDDRFFPADWMRGVVVDRLGIEPTEIPGGHMALLSQSGAVAKAVHQAWLETETG